MRVDRLLFTLVFHRGGSGQMRVEVEVSDVLCLRVVRKDGEGGVERFQCELRVNEAFELSNILLTAGHALYQQDEDHHGPLKG